MKKLSLRSPLPAGIEPLESRIAPATLLVGKLNVAGTTDYDGANTGAPASPLFYHTNVGGGSVDTTAVGGDANTYYIKLKAGDQLQQFGNGGFTPLITVTKGTVVAFFVDSTTSGVLNQVDPGELSGISLGAAAAFKLNRDLDGSVLTNYDDKLNQINMSTLVGPAQSIAGVETGGSITGGIYAGGSINKVSVNGSVTQIFAGLAANGVAFDLLRGAGNGGEGTLAITAKIGEAGGSISGVEVRSLTSLIAGDGGDGGKGGFIKDIKVLADSDAIAIKGGAGGKSVGGKSGGVGGDVSSVFISGAADNTAELVQILAGAGGSTAAVNSGGKGGSGGKVAGVFVGYDSVLGKPAASTGQLANIVEVGAGAGGSAKVGGAGGTLTNVKVITKTQNLAGNPFAIAPYEISVHSGSGGAPNDTTGGNAGIGGKLDLVDVTDQNSDVSTAADILISTGNGGQTAVANVNAKGADGGAISNVTVLGFKTDVTAGDGSSGTTGGKGGAVSKLTFLTQDLILANVVNVTTGTGGDGFNGSAGKGGDLTALKVVNSNLQSLTINAPGSLGGNGGVSAKGKGGDGGIVSGVDVLDDGNGTGPEFSGQFFLRSGIGGGGDKGGGKGGEMKSVTFFAQDVSADFAAGAGGSATMEGTGGAGAKVTSVNVTADGLFQGVQVNGVVKSGAGGAGAGKGKGGVGGDLNLININVDGSVNVTAGSGGAGAGLAGGGQGGSLIAVGAFARDGSGVLIAGDAGAGAKAANGGAVAGTKSQLVGLRAANDLTIQAGTGTAGGNGGSISGVAFGSSFDSLRPTPSGNILLQAGNGSASATVVGKGGSISSISGSDSSGINTSTRFIAGNGASSAAKGADGGAISDVLLSGVGDDGVDKNNVEIVFQAGDAGDATTAAKGAKGGLIKNLSINNLDPNAVLKSIAAGNGGDASTTTGTGGEGGTIDGVRVVGGTDLTTGETLNADIGYRSGMTYGFATMGGLFAGASGAGIKAGLAGSVRNISADSIAAIVAGRDDAPQAVEKVEKISLNGIKELQTGINSPFTITYNGNTTMVLDLTDPLSVQNAINSLGAGTPTVKVTRNPNATFLITNTANGDIMQFTAEENISTDVSEEISGEHPVLVKSTIPGTLVSQAVESFKPESSGTYVISYAGDSSAPLSYTSDAATVQAELNTNVPSIAAAGGVVVVGDNVNGFSVRFVQNGERELLSVVAEVAEVQRIDTLGVGQFQIDVGGAVTPRLAKDASPSDVQNAINNALGVANPGVTVMVAADPRDATAYVVTFDQPGQQQNFVVTEFAPLSATTVTQGGAANPEVQNLSFVPRAAFSSADYKAANLVGAIVDPNEIGASNFKFTPVGAPHVGFALGDRPIDGLIVAKVLDQSTLNFTPEASLVGGVFFDNDNKI